jgi:hypothetical protein
MPFASSVYVHVPEATSSLKQSMSVTSLFPSLQVTLNLDDKDDQLKVHLPGVGLELMDVVRASLVLPSHMTKEVLQFLTSSA